MKRALVISATTITAGIAGLVVYSLYLLRRAARDGSDEMYMR